VTSPAAQGPNWRDHGACLNHFLQHGRQLGVRTVEEYDRSAQATVASGKRFDYNDRTTGAPRVGYYDPTNFRFVGMTANERTILTHFEAREDYVRRLPRSTY
jgi:hypothetical protein